jgi:hypothetical protein
VYLYIYLCNAFIVVDPLLGFCGDSDETSGSIIQEIHEELSKNQLSK